MHNKRRIRPILHQGRTTTKIETTQLNKLPILKDGARTSFSIAKHQTLPQKNILGHCGFTQIM